MAKTYVVGNPRGIPKGTRILAEAPRCKTCKGSGGTVDDPCSTCNGQGNVLKAEWFEGDAIKVGDFDAKAWKHFTTDGLIVEAS